jgi:hypothetical protein
MKFPQIAILLSCLVFLSACPGKKTGFVNDVVHDDPKVRNQAIRALQKKPDPETLRKIMTKYYQSTGVEKSRAGYALLEVTDSVNKNKKSDKDENSKLSSIAAGLEAEKGN